MNQDTPPEFYWSKLGLRLAGLSYDIADGVLDGSSKPFYFVFTLSNLLIMCVSLFMTILSSWKIEDNIQMKTITITNNIIFALFRIIEIVSFLRNVSQIKTIITKLKKHSKLLQVTMLNTKITADVNQTCKIFIWKLFLSRILLAVATIIFPFVQGGIRFAESLPYVYWYPFDISVFPYNLLVYCLEITIFCFSTLTKTSLDALHYNVIMHLCGCLQQLSNTLGAIHEDLETTTKTQPAREGNTTLRDLTEEPSIVSKRKQIYPSCENSPQSTLSQERKRSNRERATIMIQADIHSVATTSFQNHEATKQPTRDCGGHLDINNMPVVDQDLHAVEMNTIDKMVNDLADKMSNINKTKWGLSQAPDMPDMYSTSYDIDSSSTYTEAIASEMDLSYCDHEGKSNVPDLQVYDSLQELASHSNITIVHCIHQHKAIICVTEELRNYISFFLLSQSSIVLAAVGVLSFQMVSTHHTEGGNTFRLAGMIAALYGRYFMYCWLGDHLKTTSEDVAFAAYSTPWYNASRSFKFCVQMMVMRAQRPLTLVEGGLHAFCLTRFHKVVRISYGLFAFLLQVFTKTSY